ncbi:hypothetical protein GGTG_14003 [Gaeumannomyces tritici R3-111a-1]|uniref:FAR1 domain-containing protein n=1 Tax=Gaeumannomyces tritici (strain R3-111a-1) TaxID=644352 RepID=J3PKE9_GAET3|nr:hypothetical protein GGTG_14003 [Gaeumannomyces tritici R3-111a-1]EJT68421.1 hypothetical protein GGTG_14003 [Gaeumannomyces tritici R3-111a-1]
MADDYYDFSVFLQPQSDTPFSSASPFPPSAPRPTSRSPDGGDCGGGGSCTPGGKWTPSPNAPTFASLEGVPFATSEAALSAVQRTAYASGFGVIVMRSRYRKRNKAEQAESTPVDICRYDLECTMAATHNKKAHKGVRATMRSGCRWRGSVWQIKPRGQPLVGWFFALKHGSHTHEMVNPATIPVHRRAALKAARDTVIALLKSQPDLSFRAVAELVRKEHPGTAITGKDIQNLVDKEKRMVEESDSAQVSIGSGG